jgi:deoxyribodipyrimidine photo-lyase
MRDWQPDRDAALHALGDYAPRMGRDYASNRNFDGSEADRPGTSEFSPWVTRRVLTEEELVGTALDHHGFERAEKFIQEVVWRTYFRGWLEQRPGLWGQYEQRVEALLEKAGGDYHAATAGQTGIACFDHWASLLTESGFLHNHARMWFASIWIFTLRLPWELGADFFQSQLLDFDAASNLLSWRWVAGLHSAGKTYRADADNIARYTEGRFQPGARELAAHAEPVAETLVVPEPRAPFAGDRLPDAPYALLITERDCAPAGSTAQEQTPDWVLATRLRAQERVNPRNISFDNACMKDSAQRQSGRYVEADKVVAALQQAGMDHVVTHYVGQGPAQHHWKVLRGALESGGIRVHQRVRAWDCAFWPQARAGYFRVKKRMRNTLSDLGFAV